MLIFIPLKLDFVILSNVNNNLIMVFILIRGFNFMFKSFLPPLIVADNCTYKFQCLLLRQNLFYYLSNFQYKLDNLFLISFK